MPASAPVGARLAAYRDNDLVQVGSVGTGFKEAEAIRLRKMLDTLGDGSESSRPCPIPEVPILSGSSRP